MDDPFSGIKLFWTVFQGMAACVRGFNAHDNAYADSFRSLAEIYHWRNDIRRGKRLDVCYILFIRIKQGRCI